MKKYYLLFLLIFTCVGLSIVYALIVLDRNDGLKLVINTLPEDANITINDKPGKRGSNPLPPGRYTIRVSKDGFSSNTEIIELKTEQKKLNISLTPTSAEAKEWAKKNNEKYMEFEKISGYELQKEGEELANNNPIVKFLPFRMPDYDIEYRMSEDDKVIVDVYAGNSGFRNIAINTIKSWGIDPGDYQINFINYNNPLSEGLGGE